MKSPRTASNSDGTPTPGLPEFCRIFAQRSPVPTAAVEGATYILRFANPAFCRLLGKSLEEMGGKPFGEAMPDENACLALLDRVYRTGEAETCMEREHSGLYPVWSYMAWPVFGSEAPGDLCGLGIPGAQGKTPPVP